MTARTIMAVTLTTVQKTSSKVTSPPAYERLHRIAVRKRIEVMQSPQKQAEPFSSFPQSPPHSGGVGMSNH